MHNSTIVYVDTYSIKYGLIANSSSYAPMADEFSAPPNFDNSAIEDDEATIENPFTTMNQRQQQHADHEHLLFKTDLPEFLGTTDADAFLD
ncbi:hypothetical protein ACS0TY_001349 [Phlomoides rotata]